MLEDRVLKRLETIMTEEIKPAGSYLFREGDRSDFLYYLYEGRVKLSKASLSGKLLTIHWLQSGDLVGEISLGKETRNCFHAVVTKEARLGMIPQAALQTLLLQDADLSMQLLSWMSEINRLTASKMRDLLMYGKPGALSCMLIRLAKTYGEKIEGDRIRITQKITNMDLAELIGATRESTNRLLQQLKEEGRISYEQGYIVVDDLDYLRSVCHCDECSQEFCRL